MILYLTTYKRRIRAKTTYLLKRFKKALDTERSICIYFGHNASFRIQLLLRVPQVVFSKSLREPKGLPPLLMFRLAQSAPDL